VYSGDGGAACARARELPGELAGNVVRANVEIVVDELHRSEPVLKRLIAEDRLKIIGAIYDIENGTVQVPAGMP